MAQNEWKYRVEGNYNVVFTNINNSCVLRLPKVNKARSHHRRRSSDDASLEIEFLEQVVRLVLAGVKVRYRGRRTPLTRDLIRKLSALREVSAPECYRNQTLDDSVKFGFVFPNFCKIPNRENILHSVPPHDIQPSVRPHADYKAPITISVELRPKTCYFPAFDEEPRKELRNKCHFCLRKIYNKIRHPETNQTHYCPCDMYSGDPVRIKRAIIDLISCPQRYFSVRRSDESVYSNTILQQRVSDGDFQRGGNAFNLSVFDEEVASYLGPDGRQRFLNVICSSLQVSVVGENPPILPVARPHCRKDNVNQEFKREASYEEQSPDGSVLAFLASIHRMRSTPIHHVVALNQKVKSHLDSHPCEPISMHSPKNAGLWEEAVQLARSSARENYLNDLYLAASPEVVDNITVAAVALRRYAMSRWFSCCSLIITFRQINAIDATRGGDWCRDESVQLISDGLGRDYAVSISLVDLYKAPPERMEGYGFREDEMVRFLNKHFAALTGGERR